MSVCTNCIEYYQEGGRDAQGNTRQCCSKVGSGGCKIHENPVCAECEEAPADSQKITCDLGERIVCRECAMEMVKETSECDYCDKGGHKGCALVPLGLSAKQEEGDGSKQKASTDGQERQTATLEAVSVGSGDSDRQTTG